MLATGATVSNANQIDGALVANSLTGSGELHDIPFVGTLPTSCTTVTASDTKEVQILASNSNVSVNGTGTTSSLSSVYGTAQTLEFAYNPGDTVSTKTIGAGLASVSGNNTNSLAFMEISNNANPYASGASIYFEGSVTSGEDIYADATINVLTNTPSRAATSAPRPAPTSSPMSSPARQLSRPAPRRSRRCPTTPVAASRCIWAMSSAA